MRKDLWIVEPHLWDADHVVADLDVIRQYNPQRFEMEQLTAVIYEDTDRHVCLGYKDEWHLVFTNAIEDIAFGLLP